LTGLRGRYLLEKGTEKKPLENRIPGAINKMTNMVANAKFKAS
jgi:hypothetical protein